MGSGGGVYNSRPRGFSWYVAQPKHIAAAYEAAIQVIIYIRNGHFILGPQRWASAARLCRVGLHALVMRHRHTIPLPPVASFQMFQG
jgi:hypothetical protein